MKVQSKFFKNNVILKITISLLIFIIINSDLAAQDTINNFLYKKLIIPSSLIAAGVLINNSNFEQNLQNKVRIKTGREFHCGLDDYIQFAPVVELYLGDILGVKSKNHWFDQSKYLFVSNLISTGISQAIKRMVLKIRPDGTPYSFPSGHTTIAFTNSAVLFHEYKDSSPILAYSGYFFSTSTGVLRILNDRHWLSDVLTGAGLGILVTEFVYYFEPFRNFNPFRKSENFTLTPRVGDQNYGIHFVYSF